MSPEPDRGPPPDVPECRVGAWLFVGLLALLLATAPGAIDNIDTRICFRSASSFLDRGTFALPGPTALEQRGLWAAQGTDGAWYPKFGPGVAGWLLPFVALGRLLAGVIGGPPGAAPEFVASLASSLAAAAGAWAAFRLCRETLRVPAGAAVAGALAWTLGTFQFAYAGSSYLETPLAAALLLAILWATRAERRPVAGPILCGAFAGLAVALKVAAAATVPFVLVPLVSRDVRRSLRRLGLAAVPLAVVAAVLVATNVSRFGAPLTTGYAPFGTLFRTPLLTGLGAYLTDPDLSLPLFAPAFVVGALGWAAFARRAPLAFAAAAGVFVSVAVVHALHTGYHGGTALGPRYLVPAIPALTACGVAVVWHAASTSAARVARRLVLAAVCVCVAMQVPSVLVSPVEYHTLRREFRERGAALEDVHPRWRTDPMLLARKLRGDSDRYDLRDFARDPSRAPADPSYEVPPHDRALAVWWLLAARQGRDAAWLAGGGLLALAAFAAVRARAGLTPDGRQRA